MPELYMKVKKLSKEFYFRHRLKSSMSSNFYITIPLFNSRVKKYKQLKRVAHLIIYSMPEQNYPISGLNM